MLVGFLADLGAEGPSRALVEPEARQGLRFHSAFVLSDHGPKAPVVPHPLPGRSYGPGGPVVGLAGVQPIQEPRRGSIVLSGFTT